ncbi:hypothetical protein ID866_3349 [Astraeus odoratus]|nr:hypothetical protein ID866_3349 [Astraeus odoratus]
MNRDKWFWLYVTTLLQPRPSRHDVCGAFNGSPEGEEDMSIVYFRGHPFVAYE